jgi:hypothetical protein
MKALDEEDEEAGMYCPSCADVMEECDDDC